MAYAFPRVALVLQGHSFFPRPPRVPAGQPLRGQDTISCCRSCSALYSDALQQYLLRHAPEAVTEAMNKVCAAAAPHENDFVRAAARRMRRRETW